MYIANSRATLKKVKKKKLQERRKKWNDIKCSIKTIKADKGWKTNIGT